MSKPYGYDTVDVWRGATQTVDAVVKWRLGMFKFLFKKEMQVQGAINEYLDVLLAAEVSFQQAMDLYFEKGRCDDFNFLIEATHKLESKADDSRFEIENYMYERALIPESRGDLLGLLESIDDIPGVFDKLLYMIETQRLDIPAFLV
ncbi:MAG: DUF47 family protein, partial [Verrucomicrobia bacterium]|nr:DUF47 family protein [Verrucomicrobiota bacterium]